MRLKSAFSLYNGEPDLIFIADGAGTLFTDGSSVSVCVKGTKILQAGFGGGLEYNG